MRPRGRVWWGTALVVLAASACGSTVPARSTASGRAANQELGGTGVEEAAATTPRPGVGSEAQGPAAGAVAGPRRTSTSGGTASAGATGAPAAADAAATGPVSIPATGKGWDRQFVYVGVVTQKDQAAVFARLGFAGVDIGSTEAQAQAVADDVNSKGGVFGRKLKMVFRDVQTISAAQDPSAVGESVCTYFTQDRPVVAVVSVVTLMDGPVFRGCLAKAAVPLFSASFKAMDDGAGRSLAPFFTQSVNVSWDALAPVLVQRLSAQGWFGGWNARTGTAAPGRAKVGILADSTDIGDRASAVLKRALAAAGYRDTVVFQYTDPSNLQPAILNFNGNNVTHVLVTDIELLAFQLQSVSQGYRPRYGVSSYNAPQNNLETFSPEGANNGAVGVGWAPAFDVGDANDPGPTGPGARDCMAMMTKAGQSFSGKRVGRGFASAVCDGILLTARGATAGGGLSGRVLAQGVLRAANGFSSAVGFATALSPSKRFIPGAVRDLAWVGDCSCFRYQGGIVKL